MKQKLLVVSLSSLLLLFSPIASSFAVEKESSTETKTNITQTTESTVTSTDTSTDEELTTTKKDTIPKEVNKKNDDVTSTQKISPEAEKIKSATAPLDNSRYEYLLSVMLAESAITQAEYDTALTQLKDASTEEEASKIYDAVPHGITYLFSYTEKYVATQGLIKQLLENGSLTQNQADSYTTRLGTLPTFETLATLSDELVSLNDEILKKLVVDIKASINQLLNDNKISQGEATDLLAELDKTVTKSDLEALKAKVNVLSADSTTTDSTTKSTSESTKLKAPSNNKVALPQTSEIKVTPLSIISGFIILSLGLLFTKIRLSKN